jgi:hypothetical protein
MNDLMKKFNMAKLKPMSTSMSTTTILDPDENGKAVDQREYRSIIGSLLYITAIRPDIQFVVCLYACFQSSLRFSHQIVVQQIFRYLKYTLKFGIWYSASSSLDLVGFSDADLRIEGLTKNALPLHIIFLDLLLFVGLLTNNLLSHNPPQNPSMYLLLAVNLRFFG